MEVIGIICEYNPFHNGHLYHIQKIKSLYPNSLIILVLNGYFLERGEISILTKEDKAKIALKNNVDIVVELPFLYGTQSADQFANAAVTILNNLGVKKIIFGSESNDIRTLQKIATLQNNEEYQALVKKHLDEGLNYPTALAKALKINDFEFLPNDLLGISYIKAINNQKCDIIPETIKRTSDYKDTSSCDVIVSASNIRKKLEANESIDKYLPKGVLEKTIMINKNSYFQLLKYKINTDYNLGEYLDVDEGIEYRLKKYINISKDLEEFINNVKTKRYTYNKINRMLIHILVGLKRSDKDTPIDYMKILGFNKNGQKYLNKIKKDLTIPITINPDSTVFKYELKAALIYDLINKTDTFIFEQSKKPVI